MSKATKRISPSQHHIKEDYFQWLCRKVLADDPDHSYWILLKELHKKEFYSLVDRDFNRECDGIELRRDYMFDSGNWFMDISGSCTVLEMLIALSEKINGMLSEGESKDQSYIYFWEMITNLGLDVVTDEDYPQYGPFYIDERVNRFVDREYDRNGNGGIFPIKNSAKDQRGIEIWFQMQEYLLENYPI